jgi:hypothetical protein
MPNGFAGLRAPHRGGKPDIPSEKLTQQVIARKLPDRNDS